MNTGFDLIIRRHKAQFPVNSTGILQNLGTVYVYRANGRIVLFVICAPDGCLVEVLMPADNFKMLNRLKD